MFLMSKKHLFALIIWSATLVATGAVADVPQTVDASTPGAETQGDTDEAVVRRVIAQFHTTHVPLSRAMAIAERLHEGVEDHRHQFRHIRTARLSRADGQE